MPPRARRGKIKQEACADVVLDEQLLLDENRTMKLIHEVFLPLPFLPWSGVPLCLPLCLLQQPAHLDRSRTGSPAAQTNLPVIRL